MFNYCRETNLSATVEKRELLTGNGEWETSSDTSIPHADLTASTTAMSAAQFMIFFPKMAPSPERQSNKDNSRSESNLIIDDQSTDF